MRINYNFFFVASINCLVCMDFSFSFTSIKVECSMIFAPKNSCDTEKQLLYKLELAHKNIIKSHENVKTSDHKNLQERF